MDVKNVLAAENEEDFQKIPYKAYPKRWYILALFTLVSFAQSAIWMTFSAIPEATHSYFPGADDTVITILLAWGPILFFPATVAVMWMDAYFAKFRYCMLVAASFPALGSIVRLIPCLFSNREGVTPLIFLHFGQILNGIAGPYVMSTTSRLSLLWFPPGERTFSTATATLANQLGCCIGYLVEPMVVAQGSSLPGLLIFEAGLACTLAVATWIHFPSAPPSPPSQGATQTVPQTTRELLSSMAACLRSPSFVAVVCLGGIAPGVFAAWSGTLPLALAQLDYGPQVAGLLSFAANLASIGAGILLGWLGDHCFRRRFKWLIFGCLLLDMAAFVWVTLSFPLGAAPASVLPHPLGAVFVAVVLAGLFNGAPNPLFYELAAEMTFPVSASTSAGLLTFVLNGACLVELLLSASLSPAYIHLVMTAAVALCALLMLLTREWYRRSDFEAGLLAPVPQAREQVPLLGGVSASAGPEAAASSIQ
ncbi:putative MFS-type transporter [Paratrimastix pyriformis]|uniref:MFS-type transporter n=1 Tax=Paratrimastix pyriformis TaxID=342808 RepID=A0ABQ8ULR4_9EUKA|nr:putative MFS-type transporter [Paratrimastix pyriformis]